MMVFKFQVSRPMVCGVIRNYFMSERQSSDTDVNLMEERVESLSGRSEGDVNATYEGTTRSRGLVLHH